MSPRTLLQSLLGLGLVSASPLLRRQDVAVPTATSSSSTNSGGQPVPTTAVIAISVVLGTGVIILILIQVRQWRRRAQIAGEPQDTTMQSLTAEDLAGTRRPTAAAGTATTQQQEAGTRGRRSRRRGVRRTDSGRSVKTLPEYSKEAGDEELVLVRRRSGSMSDDAFDEREEDYADDETGNESVPITTRSPSRSRSPPSITISQGPGGDAGITLNRGPAGDAAGDATGAGDISSSSITTLQNQGWGEAPTYLEAMSALDPDAPQRPQVPAPKPGALQRASSGFKELLTRPFAPGSFRSPAGPPVSGVSGSSTANGGRSRSGSTSALLHPTISRYSTASTVDYPSPWASSHSLLISPPVPNSAMRASFDGTSIPKGGLTKEQMRFLSSNEAVNLVGIRMEDIGARKQRTRSDFSGAGIPASPRLDEGGELPPPSWEQIDGERRMSEAFDRRNLAIPTGRGEDEAVDTRDQADGPTTTAEASGSNAEPDQPTTQIKTGTDPEVTLSGPDSHPPQAELTIR